MDLKIVEFADIPRWYHLFWDPVNEQPMVKIHRQFIERSPQADTATLFKQWLDRPEGTEIHDPLLDKCQTRLGEKTFGFGDSIVQVSADDTWLTYAIKMPVLQVRTGRACPKCEGTGEREFGGECFDCRGTKKEFVHQWNAGIKVAASFCCLFMALEFPPEEDVSTDERQWFAIKAFISNDRGCYLGGMMSPTFIDLLRSISKGQDQVGLESVMKASGRAYYKMFGEDRAFHHRHSFSAWVSYGNLIINCPGDACGIHPSPYVHEISQHEGVEFTCHNLDAPYQLICLLSGLAAAASMFDEKA